MKAEPMKLPPTILPAIAYRAVCHCLAVAGRFWRKARVCCAGIGTPPLCSLARITPNQHEAFRCLPEICKPEVRPPMR